MIDLSLQIAVVALLAINTLVGVLTLRYLRES